MLFSKRKKVHTLSRVDDSIGTLRTRINRLDAQIADISRQIFNAQTVRFRSAFTTNNNLLGNFQKRFVENSAAQSVQWHRNRLIEITKERDKLQDLLDRYTGQYWSKKIKKFFVLSLAWAGLFLVFTVILVGFFASLYILPLIIMITLGYFLIKKINL